VSGSAWYPLVPLALACGALAVREATRETPRDPQRVHASAEFTPPDLTLLGAVAAREPQALDVVGSASRARAVGRDGALSTRGLVEVAALDEAWRLELELGEGAASVVGIGQPLRLRLRGGASLLSAVPGCRTAVLRGTWSVGSTGGDAQFPISWMRLPGGGARLQGVGMLQGCEAVDGAGGVEWSAARTAVARLALDLVLEARDNAR
jgi:hypothetical protein